MTGRPIEGHFCGLFYGDELWLVQAKGHEGHVAEMHFKLVSRIGGEERHLTAVVQDKPAVVAKRCLCIDVDELGCTVVETAKRGADEMLPDELALLHVGEDFVETRALYVKLAENDTDDGYADDDQVERSSPGDRQYEPTEEDMPDRPEIHE